MIFIKIYYHINCFFKKILLKILYGKKIKFGKNVQFRKGFSIIISSNGNINIGDNCFFNNYCSINALDKIRIGDNCIFGENVKIYDHNHGFNKANVLIKKQKYKTGKIVIEDNCWIGSSSIILKNVHIGKNTVVSALSKVSNDIADNVVFDGQKSTPIVYKW